MRPYLKQSIVELEKLFAEARKSGDVKVIALLKAETGYRTTSRAQILAKEIEKVLEARAPAAVEARIRSEVTRKDRGRPSSVDASALPASTWVEEKGEQHKVVVEKTLPPTDSSRPKKAATAGTDGYEALPPPKSPERESQRRSPSKRRPTPRIDVATALTQGRASQLISAWTAIEVLSPSQTYRRPVDLADGAASRVAELETETSLPWQRNEKSRPNRQLFYQIVLGSIPLTEATERLLEVFEDADVERLPQVGYAPIGILTLDKSGFPVRDPAIAISSFAWGLPLALARNLQGLSGWPIAESQLLETVDKYIRRVDEDTGERLPLDWDTINHVFDQLVGLLKIPRELVNRPHFALRIYHWWKAEDPPDPPPMSSFFLADLSRAKNLVETKSTPSCLRRYLGLEKPAQYLDLLADDELLAEAVAPGVMSAARWPMRDGHPLVTLQQAAVNLATNGQETSRLLPVNGPPGTGKTTLLRDLVASVVLQRALRMVEFDDPSSAFSHTSKMKTDGSFSHLYKLDDRLKGFEIVVASSNNRAVENVSKELPLLGAVMEETTLRYFSSVADVVSRGIDRSEVEGEADQKDLFEAGDEEPMAWGLVSAVLGNARNRYLFRQAAWGHDDFGLRRYLLEASGVPQTYERKDHKTGRIVERRKPQVVSKEIPPRNEQEAKRRWKAARSRFRNILDTVTKRLLTMEEGRSALGQLTSNESCTLAQKALADLLEDRRRQKTTISATEPEVQKAAELARKAETALKAHRLRKPGLISSLFSSTELSDWRRQLERLEAMALSTQKGSQGAETLLEKLKARAAQIEQLTVEAERTARSARANWEDLLAKISAAEAVCGNRFGDAAFFERDRPDVHRDTPWLDDQTNALRAELFTAAMQVHRSFIDLAAKPIRNNLDVLFRTFFGRMAWNEKVRPLLPDLWATFHCVVPVVSTTLASVERMLGPLPPESIGWLLVDEAGQASPQHAVGALMRAKRTLVVGDPLQLEPVTSLPTELSRSVAKEFAIDPGEFLAPQASVQTLADAASQFGTTLDRDGEIIRLGVPLVVHRRCSEPMFSLSNDVAYAGLMVNGRGRKPSSIRSVLGDSRWIDVQPQQVDDKWSESEWQALKVMIEQVATLRADGGDFYVISPFRIVAQRLRERLVRMPTLQQWTTDPYRWVNERVGTIHTVQGREADTVFVVLGAGELNRAGARRWAGGSRNLLNVAVTRAKENIYVIGSRYAWASAGVFSHLESRLPPNEQSV